MLRNTVEAPHAGETKQMACGEMLCVLVLVFWSWLLVKAAPTLCFPALLGKAVHCWCVLVMMRCR